MCVDRDLDGWEGLVKKPAGRRRALHGGRHGRRPSFTGAPWSHISESLQMKDDRQGEEKLNPRSRRGFSRAEDNQGTRVAVREDARLGEISKT